MIKEYCVYTVGKILLTSIFDDSHFETVKGWCQLYRVDVNDALLGIGFIYFFKNILHQIRACDFSIV